MNENEHKIRELLQRVWFKFSSHYQNRWDDGGGVRSEKFDEWLEDLLDLSPGEILVGISRIKKHPGGWPPSLQEFRALCQHRPDMGGSDDLFSPKPKDEKRSRLVMRIETAKYKAISGPGTPPVPVSGKFVEDWTSRDQRALERLLSTWDPSTGHAGLCELLDDHPFTHGTLNQRLGLALGTRNAGIPFDRRVRVSVSAEAPDWAAS